jgi:hypothetical protein
MVAHMNVLWISNITPIPRRTRHPRQCSDQTVFPNPNFRSVGFAATKTQNRKEIGRESSVIFPKPNSKGEYRFAFNNPFPLL